MTDMRSQPLSFNSVRTLTCPWRAYLTALSMRLERAILSKVGSAVQTGSSGLWDSTSQCLGDQ